MNGARHGEWNLMQIDHIFDDIHDAKEYTDCFSLPR